MIDEWGRRGLRLGREGQLAAEGAVACSTGSRAARSPSWSRRAGSGKRTPRCPAVAGASRSTTRSIDRPGVRPPAASLAAGGPSLGRLAHEDAVQAPPPTRPRAGRVHAPVHRARARPPGRRQATRARSACGSRSSSWAARGSSSGRCWRCGTTSCPPPTATSCSAAQPGRAVQLRRGPARSSARSSARSPRSSSPRSMRRRSPSASIGQVHRATLRNGDASRSRSSGRASARSSRPTSELMYASPGCSTGPRLFGGTGSRDVIDEFAQLDRGRGRLPRRGPPGGPAPRAREGRPLRAHRPRLPRLHDVARPDHRADRGHPADRDHDRPAGRRPGLPRRGSRRPATTSTGSCAASTGTCSTRCSCSASSTPTCIRRTSSCCPGDAIGYVDFGIVGQLPNRVRRVAHALQLAPVPGRDRGRGHRAHALARPDAQTDEAAARWRLIRVHQTFLYDATADRSRMTPEAPGPIVASRENPYSKLAVDILETVRDHRLSMSPTSSATSRCWSRSGRSATSSRSTTTCPRHVRRFVRRLARQQSLSLLDPRLAMDRLYAGGTQVQRALHFVDFLEGQEPTILEAESLLFGFRRKMQNADGRSCGSAAGPRDRRGAVPGDGLPRRHAAHAAGRGHYTWVQFGLLGAADPAIVWLINFVRRLRP